MVTDTSDCSEIITRIDAFFVAGQSQYNHEEPRNKSKSHTCHARMLYAVADPNVHARTIQKFARWALKHASTRALVQKFMHCELSEQELTQMR